MATIETSYRDPALSVEARVADLLARMTRAEKIAQLGSFWAFEVVPETGFDEARLAALAADGIGQITRLAGSTNLRPVEVAADGQRDPALPRRARRGSGSPTIIHEECLHGLIAWAAPCFQQSIGAAASFDPDVVTAMAATIRRRMLLTGARHALGPGPRHRAATRAGAGSRRRTARTRTSPPSSAAPTSRRSRARTSPRASSPPPSTWSATGWPKAA